MNGTPARHPDLKTLSMDTAAQVGSVALLAGSQLLAQDHFQGAAGHAILLPERLATLLAQTACSCADLDLIAVTMGPGSFAGLRIALGCAKGIALAQGTPIIGVSNLDLLAAGTGRQHGWVSVVVDARRGEIFAALYRLENGVPYRHSAPDTAQAPELWARHLATLPALLQGEPLCLTGTGLQPYAELFRTMLPVPFETTPDSTWIGDPFLLGLLGQQLFRQQQAMTATTPGTPHTSYPDITTRLDYQRRPDAEKRRSIL
ncbi:MAG: tRNA (adenosine(37)-N6)-threonylcarbamoyltransferase complex dimerization subunit type 1 TsaB [Magnetococcales bacterium]|nr:tRNA (adenosine(37)-N6)-threonylcarbamoyltransferase complex dimerization subunit type 1 TsaB [Magnetococcales bacterium]